jgi:hypothetical protein
MKESENLITVKNVCLVHEWIRRQLEGMRGVDGIFVIMRGPQESINLGA